jgi:hypothetical protein
MQNLPPEFSAMQADTGGSSVSQFVGEGSVAQGGAETAAVHRFGQTAGQLAKACGRREIAQLLGI